MIMGMSEFMMSRNCGMNLKLLSVIVGTIIIIAVILTGVGGSMLSALLGLLLVFVLPGYALVNAFFPGNDLEFAEIIALALGLSLAIAALGGLVLYWLPWKLQTHSWTVFLGSITIFASVVALLRHQRLEVRSPSFIKVKMSLSIKEGLFFVLAGIGVAIAFVLAYRGEVKQSNSDFTQLWILPSEEDDSTVQIGINNHATEASQYRLLVKVNNEVVDEIPSINLNSEETWVNSFTLPEGADSVIADLYRLYAPADVCNGDNPPDICDRNDEVYREVKLRK